LTHPVNGPHDLGGVSGFGTIPMRDEPPRAYPGGWEGRTVGAVIASVAIGLFDMDRFRAGVESLPPIAYMDSDYFRRWLHSLERNLVQSSAITEADVERRLQELRENPDFALPRRSDPEGLAAVVAYVENGGPIARRIEAEPAFSIGDRVRARRIRIERRGEQHTRLPGYVQGREGTIHMRHPPARVPDIEVAGGPQRSEHVYTVRFDGRGLWPDGEAATVCVDLWESYLEPVTATEEDR
jgi:nitrile hydratase beta subunit